MIKFISPSTIEGKVKIKSPDDIIKIYNESTTPLSMQLVLKNGKKKVVRDIVFMEEHLYIAKADIPKEFIESNIEIVSVIAIHSADGTNYTNEIEIEVNKKTYKLIDKSSDRVEFLENKVGELERLIKLAIMGKRIPLKIPKDLGDPKPGMVMTVLADDVIGWSDLFKEVITQINEVKTVNGKVILNAKDIKLEDGKTIQVLHGDLKKNNQTLIEVLKLLKETSEQLAKLKNDFEDFKSQDVI